METLSITSRSFVLSRSHQYCDCAIMQPSNRDLLNQVRESNVRRALERPQDAAGQVRPLSDVRRSGSEGKVQTPKSNSCELNCPSSSPDSASILHQRRISSQFESWKTCTHSTTTQSPGSKSVLNPRRPPSPPSMPKRSPTPAAGCSKQ